MNIMMPEGNVFGSRCCREESAQDTMKAVVVLILSGRAARVPVTGRSHRELVKTAGRMHGMILPMPIAAHDEGIVRDVLFQKGADFVAFRLEGLVCVIVALADAVGSDNRCW